MHSCKDHTFSMDQRFAPRLAPLSLLPIPANIHSACPHTIDSPNPLSGHISIVVLPLRSQFVHGVVEFVLSNDSRFLVSASFHSGLFFQLLPTYILDFSPLPQVSPWLLSLPFQAPDRLTNARSIRPIHLLLDRISSLVHWWHFCMNHLTTI